MSVYNTIEESFNNTKNNIGFPTGKSQDINWIGKYMDTLYEYAQECNNHIVEIGVNKVCSTWAWAMARPKKITLCDTELTAKGSIWLESFIELSEKEGIEIVLEEKSSLDMKVDNVDLLFIDGLHEYVHIKKELDLFGGNVKKYIIFHDPVLFKDDVNKAALEFLELNDNWVEEYRDNDNPGLLVIKRVD